MCILVCVCVGLVRVNDLSEWRANPVIPCVTRIIIDTISHDTHTTHDTHTHTHAHTHMYVPKPSFVLNFK